jgi:foldase protein PrsA
MLVSSVTTIAILTACANGTTGGTALEVAGHAVSKATVAHWLPLEAIISVEPNPQQPVRKGEVPDPPHYTACIAYLGAATLKATSPQTRPSAAQLKSECRQRYEDIRRHTIEFLITNVWLNAEAAAQGVRASDNEVAERFAGFKREHYPTEAAFQRFLKNTGQTISDDLLLERFGLLSTKLDQKLIRERGIAGATRFTRDFPKRWAAITNCTAGYVVPDCKQYKGPLPAEATAGG